MRVRKASILLNNIKSGCDAIPRIYEILENEKKIPEHNTESYNGVPYADVRLSEDCELMEDD